MKQTKQTTYTKEFLHGMFAAYPKCKVKSNLSYKVYSVIGISFELNCSIQVRGTGKNKGIIHLYPNDIKPILTSLSEMTSEDKICVAKMSIGYEEGDKSFSFHVDPNIGEFGYDGCMHKSIMCVGVYHFCSHPDIMKWLPMYLIQIDTEELDITRGYYNLDDGWMDEIPDNMQHIIDYVRSRHYDAGYMHIKQLVSSELAIKKVKKQL